MKLARIESNGRSLLARIDGDQAFIIDGTILSPGGDTGESLSLSEVRFLVPTDPSKIVAIGINYMDHAGDRVAPTEPQPFLKTPSSLIAHGEKIILPPDSTNVHMEAELVAVMNATCSKVSPETALSYVAGYTAGNDVSGRDWQQADLQWWRAKSSDTFTAVGPWLDTEIDPWTTRIEGRISKKTQQESNTSLLINSIAACISRISHYMTLEAGDLVFTGTPGTTGAIVDGDICEVEVAEGENTVLLSNPVKQG